MDRKLRAGIIGLGVGSRHVACYEAHPDCEVAVLCDQDASKLIEIGGKYPGKKLVDNAEEVFHDPSLDIVSIASYDDAHFDQVRMGISHGKHLMVEKPICLRRDEAQEIQSLLLRHPEVRISSNMVLRTSSRFQELKEQVSSGEYGELYYMEGDYQYGRLEKITNGWRGELDYYSIVLGGAVHLVDLVLWLIEDEVVEVNGFGNKIVTRKTKFQFDDMVVAILRLKRGALVKITANFGCRRPHFHALEIYGTKKTFINRCDSAEVYMSSEKGHAPELIETPYRDYNKPDLICSFIDSILKRGNPIVSAADIFRTMDTCFAIEESVHTGKSVQLKTNH
jgi:predicted dehydrogenase